MVVSDPLNLIKRDADGEEPRVTRSRDGSSNNNIDGETMIGVIEPKGAEEGLDAGADADMEKAGPTEKLKLRREDKGKESERDAVKVRCRLSDRGGPDVVIALGRTQHVATLVRRVQVEGKVSGLVHPISLFAYLSRPDSLSRPTLPTAAGSTD